MYNLSGFLAFKTVYMFEHIQYDTKMHNRSPLSIDLCVVHVLSDLKVHYDQTLFICGGPCHLSRFNVLGNLNLLLEQLVYSAKVKTNNISEFVLTPH